MITGLLVFGMVFACLLEESHALGEPMARCIFDLVVIAALLGLANSSDAAVISYGYEFATPVFVDTASAAVEI